MSSIARDLLQELRRLDVAVRDARLELLAAAGLGDLEHRVLGTLAALAPAHARAIAVALLLPTSVIERALATLQALGYVEKPTVMNGAIPRSPTRAGHRLLHDIDESERLVTGRLEQALGEDHVRTLIQALKHAGPGSGMQRARRHARASVRREVPLYGA